MREIPLTQGKVALISEEDYERVSQYTWYALKERDYQSWKWKAGRYGGSVNGKPRVVLMHRFILDAPEGMVVDHRDGNGLNNQRENIRICTHGQNMQNRRKQRNNRSGYTGVSWSKTERVWVAQIKVDAKNKYLGRFATAEEAARAYDTAAAKYHGEFAGLNNSEKELKP